MTGPRKLTDAQRQHVTQARMLAAADPETLAGLGIGAGNDGAVYAIAYGRVKAAALVLLDIIDELTTGGAS